VKSFLSRNIVFGLFLLTFLCSASWAQKRVTSVDLTSNGFPTGRESNPDSCTEPFIYYRSLQWLDTGHIVAAFNTTPVCPKKEDTYPLRSSVRLLILNAQGQVLHSTDISYDAVLDQDRRETDEIWVGPQATVLFHIKGIPRGKVHLFSKDLEPIQDIDTDWYAPDGVAFEGVSRDRNTVFFSTGGVDAAGHRPCLKYAGVPLKRAGECWPDALKRVEWQFKDIGTYSVAKNHQALLLNTSEDFSRSAIFTIREGLAICQLSGALCPVHGDLIVYDQRAKRVLSRIRFPVYGRAALSTDGQRFATFIKNKIEVFKVQ
jgi:hypothetical protein